MQQQSLIIVSCIIFFLSCGLLVDSKPVSNDKALSVCKLPIAKGHCRALLPRWMYNPATGNCEEFHFGGCDGNGNNFKTHADCVSICGNTV